MVFKRGQDVIGTDEDCTKMLKVRKVPLNRINDQITCNLCKGYFVDATTIIECLHTFCRSCIVKYLETHKYCPVCDVLVHKTKPLTNIRPDKTMQDIVYKLVPRLYQNEMFRRRDFYVLHPESCPSILEEKNEVLYDYILTPEDNICVSLNYFESTALPRYLKCPAAVTIGHLRRLIAGKYELSETHHVDLYYNEDCLHSYLTLMEIAYIYGWRRKGPLELTYRIFENRAKRQKLNNQDVSTMNNNNWKEVQLRISENGEISVTGIQENLADDFIVKTGLNEQEVVSEDSKESESVKEVKVKTKVKISKKGEGKYSRKNHKNNSSSNDVKISESENEPRKSTKERVEVEESSPSKNGAANQKNSKRIEENQNKKSDTVQNCADKTERGRNLTKRNQNSTEKESPITETTDSEENLKIKEVTSKTGKNLSKPGKNPGKNAKINTKLKPDENQRKNCKDQTETSKKANLEKSTEKNLSEKRQKTKTEQKESDSESPVKRNKIEGVGGKKKNTNSTENLDVRNESDGKSEISNCTSELEEKTFLSDEKKPVAVSEYFDDPADVKKHETRENKALEIKTDSKTSEQNGDSVGNSENFPVQNQSSIASKENHSDSKSGGLEGVENLKSEKDEKKPELTNLSIKQKQDENEAKNEKLKGDEVDKEIGTPRNTSEVDLEKIDAAKSVIPTSIYPISGVKTAGIPASGMNKRKIGDEKSDFEPPPKQPTIILNHTLGLQNLSNNHPLKKHSMSSPQKWVNKPSTPGPPCYTPRTTVYNPIITVPKPQTSIQKADTKTKTSATILNSKVSIKNKPGTPIGYKTLRDPPKSWNPQLPRPVLNRGAAESKGVELKNVRPPKFFKIRNNMPRYLGNPASGVKPMYQVQSSPEKDKADKPDKTDNIKKHSIVKIDPKTLKPISERAPETSNLSRTSDHVDLKINTSSVSIFNPLKLQSSSPKSADRKSPKSPNKILNFTPANPFVPNLQSPTISPNQFLFHGPFNSYDPRMMAAYHSLLYSQTRLPFVNHLTGMNVELNRKNYELPKIQQTASMPSTSTATVNKNNATTKKLKDKNEKSLQNAVEKLTQNKLKEKENNQENCKKSQEEVVVKNGENTQNESEVIDSTSQLTKSTSLENNSNVTETK